MPTVLAVDDDAMQLRLWERTLVDAPFRLLATHDPQAAVRLATSHQVAVALVDTHMGRMAGPEVVRQLLAALPDLPIIAVSVDESAPAIVDMMRAGAQDYLIKPVDDAVLRRRVEALLPAEDERGRQQGLTRREAQAIDLLGEGFSTGDIATRLDLNPKTVDGIFIRLRRKLGCDSVAALRRFAVKRRRDQVGRDEGPRPGIEVGDIRIDFQHRVLCDLAGQVIRAMESDAPGYTMLATEFVAYADYHARAEEELMRQAGWSELPRHQAEHQRLLAGISGLATCADHGPEAADRLRRTLACWVEVHTQGSDQRFVAWRRQSG